MALLENQAFTRTNVNLVSRIERANGKDAAIRMVTGLVRNADGKVQAYSAYGKIADAILHEKTSLGSEMRILAIDSTVNYDTKAGEPATKHDLKIVKFWFVKRPVATEVAAA